MRLAPYDKKGSTTVDGEEKRDDQELQQSATEDASDTVVTEELASGQAVGDQAGDSVEGTAADDNASATAKDDSPAGQAPAEQEPAEQEAAEQEAAEQAPVQEEAAPTGKIKKPEVEQDDEMLDPDVAPKDWYILKVAFNREDGVRDALLKQIKMSGLDGYFGEVLVPTEDIVEFTRSGKRKIVKRKLYPGYLMIYMHVNDDTWFLVRDTTGVSDFTGTAGKPAPMDPAEVERVIKVDEPGEEGEKQLKTSIPFKVGERVRVKEGNFQNQEGEVEKLDEANGRIAVNINIFGRSVPVELDHWQVEPL